jgi:hypothetical protein
MGDLQERGGTVGFLLPPPFINKDILEKYLICLVYTVEYFNPHSG